LKQDNNIEKLFLAQIVMENMLDFRIIWKCNTKVLDKKYRRI